MLEQQQQITETHLAGRVAAHVRAEHDAVRGIAAELLAVKARGQQLDVGATAVQLLLVLHSVGDDQVLALVVEGLRQRCNSRVEACILARLDALVALSAGVLAAGVLPLAALQRKRSEG